jgi:hypothetical protein
MSQYTETLKEAIRMLSELPFERARVTRLGLLKMLRADLHAMVEDDAEYQELKEWLERQQ